MTFHLRVLTTNWLIANFQKHSILRIFVYSFRNGCKTFAKSQGCVLKSTVFSQFLRVVLFHFILNCWFGWIDYERKITSIKRLRKIALPIYSTYVFKSQLFHKKSKKIVLTIRSFSMAIVGCYEIFSELLIKLMRCEHQLTCNISF